MLSLELILELAGLVLIGGLLYAHYKLHLSIAQIKTILASTSDAANAQKK